VAVTDIGNKDMARTSSRLSIPGSGFRRPVQGPLTLANTFMRVGVSPYIAFQVQDMQRAGLMGWRHHPLSRLALRRLRSRRQPWRQ